MSDERDKNVRAFSKDNRVSTDQEPFPGLGDDFDIDLLLSARSEVTDRRYSQQVTPVMLDTLEADTAAMDASLRGVNDLPEDDSLLPFHMPEPPQASAEVATLVGRPTPRAELLDQDAPERFLSRSSVTPILQPAVTEERLQEDSAKRKKAAAAQLNVDDLLVDYISAPSPSRPPQDSDEEDLDSEIASLLLNFVAPKS